MLNLCRRQNCTRILFWVLNALHLSTILQTTWLSRGSVSPKKLSEKSTIMNWFGCSLCWFAMISEILWKILSCRVSDNNLNSFDWYFLLRQIIWTSPFSMASRKTSGDVSISFILSVESVICTSSNSISFVEALFILVSSLVYNIP